MGGNLGVGFSQGLASGIQQGVTQSVVQQQMQNEKMLRDEQIKKLKEDQKRETDLATNFPDLYAYHKLGGNPKDYVVTQILKKAFGGSASVQSDAEGPTAESGARVADLVAAAGVPAMGGMEDLALAGAIKQGLGIDITDLAKTTSVRGLQGDSGPVTRRYDAFGRPLEDLPEFVPYQTNKTAAKSADGKWYEATVQFKQTAQGPVVVGPPLLGAELPTTSSEESAGGSIFRVTKDRAGQELERVFLRPDPSFRANQLIPPDVAAKTRVPYGTTVGETERAGLKLFQPSPEAEAAAIAAATTQAKQGTEILPPTQITTIPGATYGMTAKDAAQLGAKPLSAEQQGTAAYAGPVALNVARMKELSNEIFSAAGGVGRLRATVTQTGKSLQGEDPKVIEYEALSQAILSGLAKALGERGNLAQGDVNRVKQLVPRYSGFLPATKTQARVKLDALERIIQALNDPSASPEAVKKSVLSVVEDTEQLMGTKGKLPAKPSAPGGKGTPPPFAGQPGQTAKDGASGAIWKWNDTKKKWE